MQEEITRLTGEGQYEKALALAKRLAIDALKQARRPEAASLLGQAGEILCRLNHPGKARSFALEAIDLGERDQDAITAGYAQAVAALAHLRLGELEKAEPYLDSALERLNRLPQDERSIFAKIVAAELSVAREDYAEARAFAEDAFAAAAAADRADRKAEACLIKAICEERADDLPAAIRLMTAAEKELQRRGDAQVEWMIQGALANAHLKSGKPDLSEACRAKAKMIIDRIAEPLGREARERFLRTAAVRACLGEASPSDSALWKTPLQIQTPPPPPLPADNTDLRPILDMIKKINSELNLRKLITIILDTMIEYCNAQRGTIVIFEGDKFKVEISRNRKKQDLKRFQMGISRTVLRQVRDHGKMIVLEDAQETPTLRIVDSVHEQNLMSVLCVPLRVKARLVGAVYLDNPYLVGAFGKREIGLAEILTDHAAVAIDNALLHIRAIHDGLTNLFNHSHFEKRIEQEVARARRHGRPCGLLMLDIDNFKEINDTHGHEAGNQVLRTVSRLITATVRNIDLVARIQERDATPVIARYGGDEFEVLLPETGAEGLQAGADRLLRALTSEKFTANGQELPVTFSMGGAVFPDDAPDARELALRADEALYRAKREGKNRFCHYRDAQASPEATGEQGLRS